MILQDRLTFPRMGDANGRKPVITVLGAASTTFGPKVLRDMLHFPELHGARYRMVDVQEDRLEVYTSLARRMSAALPNPCPIEAFADRRKALPGSDVVIISVDRGHFQTWEQDFRIPVEKGIRQVLGELGGPGGMFHSLRQIPLHLEFGRDIADLCPGALVMVCSNPLNRICRAMQLHTGVGPVVGLCHGVEMLTQLFLPKWMNLSGDLMQPTAAGTNHLTWLLGLRRKDNGADLLPRMAEVFASLDPKVMPLTRKIHEVFGYAPSTLDSHTGEYLSWAWDICGPVNPDFASNLEQEEKRWVYLRNLAEDDARWERLERHLGTREEVTEELQLDPLFAPRSWADTLAFPLMAALHTNQAEWMPALNLPNEGQIDNLPRGVFVETPAWVDGSGMHPVPVGNLPAPLAAFNRRDLDQMELMVEAAVTGDRKLVLQAMLLDPVVDSVAKAEATIEAMVQAQGDLLPFS